MKSAAFVALFATACSWAFVRGPVAEDKPGSCTDSSLLPSLDGLVGVGAVAGSIGGEFVTRLTDHTVENYELVVGVPLLVVGVAMLYSASYGTDRVNQCLAAKYGDKAICDGCDE